MDLINDIISADETYFYDVSNIDKSRNRTTFEYYERDVTKKNYDSISNYSITPRNIGLEKKDGYKDYLPGIDNVDGYVRISPVKFYYIKTTKTNTYSSTGIVENTTIDKEKIFINRSSMVFHELAESYYRTTKKLPYLSLLGIIGAHEKAVIREGYYYGNPIPGKSTSDTGKDLYKNN